MQDDKGGGFAPLLTLQGQFTPQDISDEKNGGPVTVARAGQSIPSNR